MTSILVVDDRAVNGKLLSTVLVTPHTQCWRPIGRGWIELAEAERPALIISDIVVPTMDGYEFVRELQTRSAVRHIPVISTPRARRWRRRAGLPRPAAFHASS